MRETPPTADVIDFCKATGRFVDPADITTANIGQMGRSDWDTDPPPRNWLIPDLLPEGRVGLLCGEGGLGKSRLALQLASCYASGDEDWLPGCGTKLTGGQRHVVYLSYEDEHDEMNRRLVSIMGRERIRELGSRLVAIQGNGSDLGALWQPASAGSRHTSTLGEPSKAMRRLQNQCEASHTGLLIIDTVASAFLSNENDRGLVTQFINYMDAWAIDTTTTVLILGHPPKSGGRYSGNSGWRGSARFLLSLERAVLTKKDGESGGVRWPALICDKNNYGVEHGATKWWLTTDRRLGMDISGKAEVVGRHEAQRIYETAMSEPRNEPPADAYDDDGDSY